MRVLTATLFIGLVTTCSLTAASAATPQGVLIGEASDLKTGEKLYTEEHRFYERDGRQVMRTRYLSPEETEVASREVLYDNQRVASYQLHLHNLDYQEAIDRKEGELLIRVEPKAAEKKSRLVEADQAVVIDAGFNEYILRNWVKLMNGEKAVFDFASTAQLDVVRLQVAADKKLSTDEIQVFSMTAANPLFRLLMKPIKAGYYKDTKQLAYYRGISNIKDNDGDAYQVEISFANNQFARFAVTGQASDSTTIGAD